MKKKKSVKIFVIVALAVVLLIVPSAALWVSIHWDGWSPAVYERRHNIIYYKGDLLERWGSRVQTINSATELTRLMPQWQEIDRYDSAFFEESFLLHIQTTVPCAGSYFHVKRVRVNRHSITVYAVRELGVAVEDNREEVHWNAFLEFCWGLADRTIKVRVSGPGYSQVLHPRRARQWNVYEERHNIRYIPLHLKGSEQYSTNIVQINSSRALAYHYPSWQGPDTYDPTFFKHAFLLIINTSSPCSATYLRIISVNITETSIEVEAVTRTPYGALGATVMGHVGAILEFDRELADRYISVTLNKERSSRTFSPVVFD